jgi:hypothetical protein
MIQCNANVNGDANDKIVFKFFGSYCYSTVSYVCQISSSSSSSMQDELSVVLTTRQHPHGHRCLDQRLASESSEI